MASTAVTAGKNSMGGEASSDVQPGDISTMSTSIIDMDIFGQLLEMDDEEDREFSKEIVWNYFDQAESTFEKMDTAL
jgi:osomolarity two-component system phosphorelay intermediate protein YPD1